MPEEETGAKRSLPHFCHQYVKAPLGENTVLNVTTTLIVLCAVKCVWSVLVHLVLRLPWNN